MRRHSPPTPQRFLAALLSALLVLGPGAAALAAPARTALVVLPYAAMPGVSDAFAARVTAQILAELHQRSELKLVNPPAQAASKDSAAKAQNEAERARAWATQQFNKAGELSQANKPKPAAQALQRAAAQLTAQPLALDEAGGKLLGDILLQLSVARATAGDEDGADQSLAELVHRAPERTMQSGSFPPAFVRSFETARLHALSASRGQIRVFAPPGIAAARVLLDGRPLGNAPVLLTEALPGEHALRVESAQAAEGAWAETIKLEPGAQLSVAPKLGAGVGPGAATSAPSDPALAQGSLDRAAASRLIKLAKAANAQAALVGTVSREGDGYTVRSALVLVRGERVFLLAQLGLDAEMLSASLEVLRLADDLMGKLAGSAPGAPLPIALGGSTAASATAGDAAPSADAAVPSVIAAPPAPESALALPAAADLAAAAGTNRKDLPLPDATQAVAAALPPDETPTRNVALPLPAAAPALVPAPVPATPAATASRTPMMPGAVPVTPIAPVPAQPAPALAAAAPIAAPVTPSPPPPAPTPIAARTPAIPGSTPPAPVPLAAPASAPIAPIAGSLDAAVAGLSPSPAPAATPADRRVSIPGTQAPPLPAAPEPVTVVPSAPTAATFSEPATINPSAPSASTDAPLAVAGPKRIEEAPSQNLFIPRNPTREPSEDPSGQTVAVTAPDAPAAPPASVHMQALEANEVATVREEPQQHHSHAALWIVAGALVVGAAIVGGVVLYSNSQSATSSNVSLNWSH